MLNITAKALWTIVRGAFKPSGRKVYYENIPELFGAWFSMMR